MSCHEYRYLIQHRFDEDLDADEVESVDDHIDQCESCQKFEHQLDQMIQGAEEMPLPEELTPPNPEALAKMVQDKLPQQKSSVFSMFTEMFSGGNKQASRGNKGSKDKTEFPKRGKSVANKRESRSVEDAESEEAMSGRLKSLAREPDESRDLQSTTRGLGEKFGFANAPTNEANAAPLTLAESIRRKISESQKLSVEDEGDMTSDDRLTAPTPPPGIAQTNAPPLGIAQTGGDQWNAPMKMSGQAQPDAGWTPGGAQPNSWTPNQNQSPPSSHPGSAIGLAAPGSDSGWNEDKRPPRGTSAGDENAGWGPPPAGGAWEDPSGGGGAQPQAGQEGWGAGASSSWATSPSPTQPGADQFGSGGWNVPSAKENQTSGAAPAPAAPAPGWGGGGAGSPDGWGGGGNAAAPAGGGAVNSWGAPPSGAAQGQQGGWSDGGGGSAAGASWDAGKSDTASGSWAPTNTPPANAAGDSWGAGGGNDSWGAPNNQQGGAAADSWGGAPGADQQSNSWGNGAAAPAPAAAPTPAPANDAGWGQPAGGGDQGGWGSGSGQSWGGAPAAQASAPQASAQPADQGGWGAPAAATPAANPGGGWGGAQSGGGDGGWGSAPPAPPPAPGATASGDWTATSGGETTGGWGGAAAPAPAKQPEGGAPGWGASASQGGWDTQPWDDKSEAKQRGNWSIEAEQMETGTWSSYSGAQAAAGGNALGAKPPAQTGQKSSEMSQDRWDTPIQERGAPAAPAAAQAAGESHWDVPIQEKLKGKTDPGAAPPAAPAAPGWGAPAAAPAAPAAAQGAGESHWDLPIQEKLKQQQAGGAAPYENTPPQPFGQPPAPADSFGGSTGAPPSFGAPPGAPAAPPAFGAAPGAPSAPPAFGAAPGAPAAPPAFGGAPADNAFGAPPAFGAAPGAPASPPAFGQPPADTTPPAFGAPPAPSFGGAPAPAAPAPASPAAASGGAGLFSKPLDDNAMDQIFDGLGIKESGVQPVQSAPAAAPQQATLQQAPNVPPPAQPPAPGGWGAPPAPAAPAAGGWGAPPAPAGVPDTMSFAPEVQAQAEAPRLTAIPPKAPTTETQAPLPAPPPPAMPGMPAPSAAPQVAPVQSKKAGGGMFSLDDDAVDQIFAKIGVEESSIPVNQGAAAPAMPAAAAQMPAAAAAAPAPPAMPSMPAPPAMTPPALGQPPAPSGMVPPPAMPNAGAPPAFGMAPPAGMTPPGGMAPPAGFGAPPGGMPAAPMPPQMPAAPAAAPQQNKSGLFQVDDKDMDSLFDKVLLNPGSEGATAAVSAPAPQPPMGAAPPPGFGAPPAPQAGNGQYPQQGAMPAMPPAMPGMPPAMPGMGMPGMAPAPAPVPAPEPPAAAVAHVPQSNLPPPKIEGIGKLDASADVEETGSGRIAAIGKFLLDQKDLEKLSKITAADQQDIKMRILTLEASEDLQTLLSEIGGQEKVIGSVIVGHDGLLIANTMPEEVDAESIGVWALGVYMNTEHVTKKMGHERVHQVVSRTPRGYVVIADFGGGLLVTITEGTDTDTLIPLMRKITDLVS